MLERLRSLGFAHDPIGLVSEYKVNLALIARTRAHRSTALRARRTDFIALEDQSVCNIEHG